MMKIDLLKSSPDRAGRYFVRFEDGSVYRIYRQTIEDFRLYPGLEMDDPTYRSFQKSVDELSAKMRAVRIISATNISKKDLEKRLIQKGENAAQAKCAVSWLEDLSLIDDRKTAEQIVHSCIAKGYGLARAKQALFEKRIPKDCWDDALSDYPDQRERIISFLKQKLAGSHDDKEVRKAIDALMRRGHNYHIIREVLNELSLDAEEFLEDI